MITINNKSKVNYTYNNNRLLYRNSDVEDYNKFLKVCCKSYTGLKWKATENKLNRDGELTLRSKERIAGTLRNNTPNSTHVLRFNNGFHIVSNILFSLIYGFHPTPIFALHSKIVNDKVVFSFNKDKAIKTSKSDLITEHKREFVINGIYLVTKNYYTLPVWYSLKNKLMDEMLLLATGNISNIEYVLTFIKEIFQEPTDSDLEKIVIMLNNNLYPLY